VKLILRHLLKIQYVLEQGSPTLCPRAPWRPSIGLGAPAACAQQEDISVFHFPIKCYASFYQISSSNSSRISSSKVRRSGDGNFGFSE